MEKSKCKNCNEEIFVNPIIGGWEHVNGFYHCSKDRGHAKPVVERKCKHCNQAIGIDTFGKWRHVANDFYHQAEDYAEPMEINEDAEKLKFYDELRNIAGLKSNGGAELLAKLVKTNGNLELSEFSYKCKHCGESIFLTSTDDGWKHLSSNLKYCTGTRYFIAEPESLNEKSGETTTQLAPAVGVNELSPVSELRSPEHRSCAHPSERAPSRDPACSRKWCGTV